MSLESDSEDLATSRMSQLFNHQNQKRRLLNYKSVPLHEWFFNDAWKNGANVDYADKNNTKVGNKKNAIQISSTEHLIIYDLETEQELDHVLYYEQFCEIERFVDPGCQLYSLRQKDKPKFSRGTVIDKKNVWFEVSRAKISCNPSETIYTSPMLKGVRFGTCY